METSYDEHEKRGVAMTQEEQQQLRKLAKGAFQEEVLHHLLRGKPVSVGKMSVPLRYVGSYQASLYNFIDRLRTHVEIKIFPGPRGGEFTYVLKPYDEEYRKKLVKKYYASAIRDLQREYATIVTTIGYAYRIPKGKEDQEKLLQRLEYSVLISGEHAIILYPETKKKYDIIFPYPKFEISKSDIQKFMLETFISYVNMLFKLLK